MPRETAAERRNRIHPARREKDRVERIRVPQRRARSADQLSPLRHHENLLLGSQPRRKSADGVLVMTVGAGSLVDPDDPGRLISSAGSARSLPSGTRALDAKLLALIDEQERTAETHTLLSKGGGGADIGSWSFARGSSAPAGSGRPTTPLTWDNVEIGANTSRRRHAVKLARSSGRERPKSAIEVAESALDGTFRRSPKRWRRSGTANPSVSTAAPPEREVAKRIHDLYHSAKGEFDDGDSDDGDERESVYNGSWISHVYVPTKRGNQRRAGLADGAASGASIGGMGMAEMMAAAVKAQQQEEDLERRTGMTKEMRAAAAKRQRRLQRERQRAQEAWQKKRMQENLGEGMVGEWRPGLEHEGESDVPIRKPLRAARLAARDRRRGKETSLGRKLSTQIGRIVARAVSR